MEYVIVVAALTIIFLLRKKKDITVKIKNGTIDDATKDLIKQSRMTTEGFIAKSIALHRKLLQIRNNGGKIIIIDIDNSKTELHL